MTYQRKLLLKRKMVSDMWQNILYSSIAVIIIIVLIILVVYLVNMRNMKQQKNHYREIHENLKIGNKVIVLNGIYGSVDKINDDTIDLKVKSGAIIEVSRYSITKIIK